MYLLPYRRPAVATFINVAPMPRICAAIRHRACRFVMGMPMRWHATPPCRWLRRCRWERRCDATPGVTARGQGREAIKNGACWPHLHGWSSGLAVEHLARAGQRPRHGVAVVRIIMCVILLLLMYFPDASGTVTEVVLTG